MKSDPAYPPLGNRGFLLEIACFDFASAIKAAAADADRIELCENPADGGTTPSYGYLKTAREKVLIPVFPIIRARGGDFFYCDDEFAVMKKDVAFDEKLSQGNLLDVKTWLDEHVHKYGSLYFPKELVKKATGEALNPQHFVDYLTKKYSEIYKL